MSHVYVDSSVIVSFLFEEKGRLKYQRILDKAKETFSSCLLEVEVLASAVCENVPLELAYEMMESISLVMPERSMTPEYQRIFAKGYCRGADAFHLATALYLEPSPANLIFLTADKAQAKIARSLGFGIHP